MELKINGINRTLKFGTGFVRKLDEIYTTKIEGMEFGTGLIIANIQLSQMNPSALSDIIRCAVKGNPKQVEVDNFVDDYADENEGLKELFEQITEELGKSQTVKDTMERAEKAKAQVEAEEEE